MSKKGKEYEVFVANLQQAILDSENFIKQKNIIIELNKKIIDNCGIEREFDLYWEYDFGGITYKTVIECKDYNSNISVEKIDSLIGKIKDIPDLKAIFATKKGYQRGAKVKANKNSIDLLIVREQNDSDWEDKFGNSYIKEIFVNIQAQFPARILNFYPTIDGNWVKSNTSIDTSKPFYYTDRNDKIIIEDLKKNEKYSIFDLEKKLSFENNNKYGNFTKEVSFDNAFIYCNNTKLKLNSYKVEYVINRPLSVPMHIDFSKELIGVIEYLQKGKKRSVYNKGEIREENI